MKVLHVISGDLWAGAEVQAYTLLTTLQKQPGLQVAAAILNEGELARRLRERGIPVTVFPENRLNALQILRGLRKLMADWQPDIVHTHRTKENILGSIANRLSVKAPSVRTQHGASEHITKGLHKKLLRQLDLWCGMRLQQKVIAVSDDLADKLAEVFPRDKIAVIENGVDIDAVRSQIHPVEFRNREPHSTHVGIVGRLVPVKRIDLFLETAAALYRQFPSRPWHFHVFGDGPLLDKLKAQAERLRLSGTVTFHGHRNDIIACMAALDALIMCSDHEGLPMTLLEALAVGTPVAGHAVGGITKVLRNSDGGTVVEQQAAEAYALAIQTLLDKERQKVDVPACYTAAGNAQHVSDLYREIAGDRS